MSKKTEERYKSLPAGVRNNNYLNIKKSASKWQGTRLPERNHPFVEFISPEWGYRAAFIIMAKTYRSRGIKTGRLYHHGKDVQKPWHQDCFADYLRLGARQRE